jgi:hypothetical protein
LIFRGVTAENKSGDGDYQERRERKSV